MSASQPVPASEDLEDLILSCRYGDLEDVKAFVARFGADALDDHVDEHGNSCLHMAAANGHADVVVYLLDFLQKPTSLVRPNHPPASNTPLHWAALNHHLAILRLLCPRLTVAQVSTLNGRGMSAMSEAMEGVSLSAPMQPEPPAGETAEEQIPIREQCVNYLVQMMKLGEEEGFAQTEQEGVDSLNQTVSQTLSDDLRPICLR